MKPSIKPYNPPENDGLDIIYCDNEIIAVNKPAGLLSVPGRGPEKQDCMLHRVQTDYPEALTVHRLDMETSGIILFARNPLTHRQLSTLFQERRIKKQYIALVSGRPEPESGKVDLPLITDWENRPRQKVDYESGKPSETHYNLLEYYTQQNNSRMMLTPITGRSHQLRVHMLALGHMIIGDYLYGYQETSRKEKSRLMLHASMIEFTHPESGKELCLSSKADF